MSEWVRWNGLALALGGWWGVELSLIDWGLRAQRAAHGNQPRKQTSPPQMKVKWTNQLTWVICLCGIEEFMNQWSKTKSESIEFVNGARGPPPKGAQQTINWREWMKRNGVEWNEIHLNWIVAARLWAGGHLFFHFTPLINSIIIYNLKNVWIDWFVFNKWKRNW